MADLAAVFELGGHRPCRLTAGQLVEIATRLRDIQQEMSGDGQLWQEKAYVASCADLVERRAGARAVQEMRAASDGHPV